MTMPLPPPGAASPEDRKVISLRFIQHAKEELQRGNRLQASEKTWGSLAQAFKAIAQERGWQHEHHGLVVDAGRQIGKEYEHTDVLLAVSHGNNMHLNFYENRDGPEPIEEAITAIERVLPELERLRSEAPRPYTIIDIEDRNRLRRLTGDRGLQVGDMSLAGFSLRHTPDSTKGE